MFTTNFNKDSYTDLILFNPQRKQMLSLEGNQSGSFNQNKPYRVLNEISNIQNLSNRYNRITGHIFSSRKSMMVGLFEFLKDGRMKLRHKINFKYYPESISAADVNGNGINEILVTGSAFDGISIISINNDKPVETKLAGGNSYSNALFIDLSNDGFADIAAVNLNENCIDYFYNNGTGNFKFVRSIPVEGRISQLKSFDMNLDYFEDLVFTSGRGIEILYGDPASSFENRLNIKTEYAADKLITGDFNRDGKIDIVYLNFLNGIVSVLIAKSEMEFYPEIIYLKKKGLKDIVPFYSRFITGLAALSSEGEIFTITNFTSISDQVNLSLGAEPSALCWFDNDNNGIIDFAFIDKYDSKLKFILRDAEGVPSSYFSYPLYRKHNRIVVDYSLTEQKTFYCFSDDDRLIESVTVNFKQNDFTRHSIYSPGKIADFKIKREEENIKIYTAYLKQNNLGFSVTTNNNFRFITDDYPAIAHGVSGVNISLLNSPSLYYWQAKNNKVILSRFNSVIKKSEELVNADLPGIKIKSTKSFVGDLFNSEKDVSITFFNGDGTNAVVIANDEMTRILRGRALDDESPDKNFPEPEGFYFNQIRLNGIKKLTYFNPEDKFIYRIDFIHGGRNFIPAKVASINNNADYFIQNMSYKEYHVVYSNLEENCITIKKI